MMGLASALLKYLWTSGPLRQQFDFPESFTLVLLVSHLSLLVCQFGYCCLLNFYSVRLNHTIGRINLGIWGVFPKVLTIIWWLKILIFFYYYSFSFVTQIYYYMLYSLPRDHYIYGLDPQNFLSQLPIAQGPSRQKKIYFK